MLNVFATYRTDLGTARGVADLLARHAAAGEQEARCRQSLVHQALDDPARFFLYETYDSETRSPSTGSFRLIPAAATDRGAQ